MGRMGARGIIEYDGKFFLVRNVVSPDFWCLPGGGIEKGEDVMTAISRELIEETGITPDVGNLLYVHQIKGPDGYGTPEFIFHIRNGHDYIDFDVTKTTHGEAELAEAGFVDISTVTVLPKFLKADLPDLASKGFSTPTRFRLSE
jgi:8-oxo-dGTP diphosphatase